MNTESVHKIERYLHGYAVMLDYWSADEGDTHLMVDYRDLLNDNESLLSDDQKKRLADLDGKAERILEAYQGDETWDVLMLRDAVAYSKPGFKKAA